MKSFFKWQALGIPTRNTALAAGPAHLAGATAFALGAILVLTGATEGLLLYLPLLLSVFLFGLPHGAIDHLVLLGLAERRMDLTGLILVCSIYLALVLAFLVLWWVGTLLALTLFLLITVYHWGQADLAFETLLEKRLSRLPKISRRWHALFRGSLPIGLPFLAFPLETKAFLVSCASGFGYSYELSSGLRLAISIALLLLAVGEVYYLKNLPSRRGLTLIEDLGLILFFLIVPPILAIGLYFCLWHGLRHVLRLLRYGKCTTAPIGTLSELKTFYIRALPFTLASLLIVAVVFLLAPGTSSPSQILGTYLVVISSLTLPHLLVVEWMDRRETKLLGVLGS